MVVNHLVVPLSGLFTANTDLEKSIIFLLKCGKVNMRICQLNYEFPLKILTCYGLGIK